MRHHSWDYVTHDLLGEIVERFGGTIIDKRDGKRWDVGQAVCVEAYGPDWMNSPLFQACDAIPVSEPAPLEFIHAAEKIASGQTDWIANEDKRQKA